MRPSSLCPGCDVEQRYTWEQIRAIAVRLVERRIGGVEQQNDFVVSRELIGEIETLQGHLSSEGFAVLVAAAASLLYHATEQITTDAERMQSVLDVARHGKAVMRKGE